MPGLKILLIEDDPNKESAVRGAIAEISPGCELVVRRSYQSGLAAALTDTPTTVVLDMSLPTWDEIEANSAGRARPFGGREILHQLTRRHVDTTVIVVTQFESFGQGTHVTTLAELDHELATRFPALYAGYVFYDPSGISWREPFRRLLVASLARNATTRGT